MGSQPATEQHRTPAAWAAAIEDLHAATAIYTAEPIVEALLECVRWPADDRVLLDPSCGDGVFLGQALRRLFAHQPDIAPHEVLGCLEGWEVHPGAAQQARDRMAEVMRAHGWGEAVAKTAASQLVRQADFLTDGPGAGRRYHVVAGNPPYLRFVNVPGVLRAEYRDVTPRYAQADLLHSFLDRCARILTEDGEVAMVTADRWLFNLGAGGLREALGRRLGIAHLERLDAETAFYRPKDRRRGTPPRIHPIAVVLSRKRSATIPLGRAAIYPDAPTGSPEATRTLGDIAHIRQGPWLGAQGIFVVTVEVARTLPPEYLVPAVGPRDIVNGRLRSKHWVIRTTAEEPPPTVLAHLDANLDRMAPRGRRTPRWLPPESWGDMPWDRPSLLIRRIARTLKPIRLPAGVLPTNHDVSIVGAEGDLSLEELEALLRSETAHKWMIARAARLEGGYFSVTPTLLRQLPVLQELKGTLQ